MKTADEVECRRIVAADVAETAKVLAGAFADQSMVHYHMGIDEPAGCDDREEECSP